MKARAHKSGGEGKTIAVFALLGPPIAAILAVVMTIPLPSKGLEIAVTLGIAIALGYAAAFVPLLISGAVAVLLSKRGARLWLRCAAAIGTAGVLTFLVTLNMGRPQDDATLFMPLYYAGFAALAALICLAMSHRLARRRAGG